MSRRNTKLQVDTFPFLAVLLCAMGALILVLLVMDRRSKLAANQRAQEQLRQQAADHAQAKQRRRDEYDAKKRAQQAAWDRKRDALKARVDDEEKALSAELREVQERLAATARRLRDEEDAVRALRDQLKQEQARLGQQEQKLEGARQETASLAEKLTAADTARAKLAAELVQLEDHIRDLKKSREREKDTYSVIPYRGKRGDGRQPLYVECGELGFVFHPEKQRLDGPSTDALAAEMGKRVGALPDAKQAYFLLLVRPDGIQRFYQLQAVLREKQIDYGYELVNPEWKFDIPATPPAPITVREHTPEQKKPGVRLVGPGSQEAPAGHPGQGSGGAGQGIGLVKPVPFGADVGGEGKGGYPPVPQEGPIVSMHRPVSRPGATDLSAIVTPTLVPQPIGTSAPGGSEGAGGRGGIVTPSLLPQTGGSATGGGTEGGGSGQSGGEKGTRGGGQPGPLRPAQVSGNGELVIFVECRADVVVVHPTRTSVTTEHLTHTQAHNKLYQTVRQIISRRQALAREANAPAVPVQVRFLIHRDAERTFHRAYPVLDGLQVPKTQYNLMPDDDVARLIASY